MCGITGIFSLSGKPIKNAVVRIQAMTDMLIHRGPDYQGIYVSDDGLAALGNTRLAIVDPNCREPQPMISGDGGGILTFNGEIYNHQDLRRDLAQKKVGLRTHIDTEVVLEGIRKFGPSFIDRLDGMWTFAFFDLAKRTLLLSRDLMGERHVYYRVTGDELVFASEPTPIVADASEPLEFNVDSILTAMRFNVPPPGRSLISGILRMLPGHNLVARVGLGIEEIRRARLHPEKWFDFFRANPSEQQIIERYEEVLLQVCQNRIPTEVPFISTLSGGIDSTLISLYASNFGARKISTLFGQSSDEPGQNLPDELDEFATSKVTSAKIGSDHHHIHLDANSCVPVLERMAGDGFDGMLDAGAAPFEMLGQRVRDDGSKVILISDGPDELIGGYQNDRLSYRMDQRRENSPLWFGFLKTASATRLGRRLVRRIGGEEFVVAPHKGTKDFVFRPVHESFIPDFLEKIVSTDLINRSTNGHYGVVDSVYDDIAKEMDPAQKRALSYAGRSLPDMFNLRSDKAFLRTSIECRLPWQAPEIIELMLATPTRWRFNGGKTTKYILRCIVEKHLGPRVSNRSKHGFASPLWSRPLIYKQLNIDETIAGSSLFSDGIFRRQARELILNDKPGYRPFKWPLYVLARTRASLDRFNRYQHDGAAAV